MKKLTEIIYWPFREFTKTTGLGHAIMPPLPTIENDTMTEPENTTQETTQEPVQPAMCGTCRHFHVSPGTQGRGGCMNAESPIYGGALHEDAAGCDCYKKPQEAAADESD